MGAIAKHKVRRVQFIFSTFLLLCSLPSTNCYEIHNITQSQSLSQGNTLVSPSRIFELGFFTPNRSSNHYVGIWYAGISPRTVVWVANRENPIRPAESPATLTVNTRGNLEILDRANNSLWSTNATSSSSNGSVAAAFLSDAGNLSLKEAFSTANLWQSFDSQGDTLLPGSKLGFNLETNETYVLTSWRSESDPSPGDFVAGIAPRMPPEARVWAGNGSELRWRSGPWDKSKFTGIPDMDTDYRNDFNLVEYPQDGTTYLQFSPYQESITNLFLSPDGFLRMKLLGEDGKLEYYWEAPQRKCSFYGACGPNEICDDRKNPICRCLKGFVPIDRANRTLGCVRRKETFCERRNSTTSGKRDGFGIINDVKVPDFYEYVEVGYLGCHKLCLENCSCVAYAYVEGIGCLVWSGGLVDIAVFSITGGIRLFFRLAHEELADGDRTVKITASLAAIFTAAIIGITAFSLHKRRARKREKLMKPSAHGDTLELTDVTTSSLQVHDQQYVTDIPVINFATILAVTNNFSQTNKLGQGGFGSVYKGTMPNGNEIAVKRLSSNSGQGIEEFKNEIALIAKLQHRNLVKLYGYCVEDDEKLLVYEYMPNKSLDRFIFDRTRGTELSWASRWNIVQGIARGLVYLHRDSCLRVIHRDLKVSNILLDEKMNPKISDFGLARIFQGTMDLTNTQRVVGTLGYMSPEYAMGGIFSEKSDVFSFGVLILEIVSGKKNTTFPYLYQQLSLVTYAWELWSESKELELADKAFLKSCSKKEVTRCIHIGLLCVQDHASDRPTMPEVVQMLGSEISLPRPSEPMFALQSTPRFDSRPQSGTVNQVSISLVEPR